MDTIKSMLRFAQALALGSMLNQSEAETAAPKKEIRHGILLPAKEWNKRKKKRQMQKASRKSNRATA